MAFALQTINVVLLIAGGLCCVGVLVWWVRTGRWGNPLLGVIIPRGGPTIVGLGVVVLGYVALLKITVSLVAGGRPTEASVAPGSPAWHQATLAEQAAGLLVALLMIALLAHARREEPSGPRLGVWAGIGGSVLALFVLLPLTALQSEMGRLVWRWYHPEAAPPLHAVLQAVGHSAWGRWGTVQLAVGAVVIAPLCEELFFRGLLLHAACYHLRHAWAAVAVSAVAFGLVHAQPQDVLPLLTLGVVLGYLRLRCGVLWPCVLLHALFNARTMIFVMLAPELVQELQ